MDLATVVHDRVATDARSRTPRPHLIRLLHHRKTYAPAGAATRSRTLDLGSMPLRHDGGGAAAMGRMATLSWVRDDSPKRYD